MRTGAENLFRYVCYNKHFRILDNCDHAKLWALGGWWLKLKDTLGKPAYYSLDYDSIPVVFTSQFFHRTKSQNLQKIIPKSKYKDTHLHLITQRTPSPETQLSFDSWSLIIKILDLNPIV